MTGRMLTAAPASASQRVRFGALSEPVASTMRPARIGTQIRRSRTDGKCIYSFDANSRPSPEKAKGRKTLHGHFDGQAPERSGTMRRLAHVPNQNA
jgi:hypothetical protein